MEVNVNSNRTVLVPGGGGYVGARLVPELLKAGYKVKVVDIFWFGENVLDEVKDNPNLAIIKGDLRDRNLVKQSLKGVTDVIHLACISNDPSADLNSEFTKSISFDAVVMFVEEAKRCRYSVLFTLAVLQYMGSRMNPMLPRILFMNH